MLVVDASADAVGIGTAEPSATLDVAGTARIRDVPTALEGHSLLAVDGNGNITKSTVTEASVSASATAIRSVTHHNFRSPENTTLSDHLIFIPAPSHNEIEYNRSSNDGFFTPDSKYLYFINAPYNGKIEKLVVQSFRKDIRLECDIWLFRQGLNGGEVWYRILDISNHGGVGVIDQNGDYIDVVESNPDSDQAVFEPGQTVFKKGEGLAIVFDTRDGQCDEDCTMFEDASFSVSITWAYELD